MAVEIVDVAAHLEPVGRGAAIAGSMRGPATAIMRSSGTVRRAIGWAAIDLLQQVAADAGAADGDDADQLVVAVAELVRQRPRSANVGGMKPVM